MMEPKEILTKRKIEKLAEEYGYKGELVENEQTGNEKYDVFVSHSSQDIEFIKKVLLFLKSSKGVNRVYVDWLDPDMKHETDAQTAVDLKKRIENAKKLFMWSRQNLLSLYGVVGKLAMLIVPKMLIISQF